MTYTKSDPDGIVLDLENDWAASTDCLRAVKRGSLVFLVGSVDGENQTDDLIATLPDGYCPTEYVYSVNGDAVIDVDGTITCSADTVIHLGGTVFWAGSK